MADDRSISGNRRDQGQRDANENLFIAMASLLEDAPSPFSVTVFAQAMDSVQLLSFAFAPIYGYSMIVVGELSYAAYASRIPVWDGTTMGNVNLAVCFGIMLGCLVLVLLAVAALLGLVAKVIERHSFISSFAAGVIQLFSGVLFIPSLHLALSPLFCKNGNLVWFPNYGTCYDGLHIAAFVIGIIATFVFAAVGFIGSTFFCRVYNGLGAGDPSKPEGNVMDRAHPYVEIVLAVGKIIVVVFYHILLGLGDSPIAFNAVLLAYCFVALLVHAAILPFHTLLITRARCGVYCVTAWAAALNIAFVGGAPTLGDRQLHAFLFAAGFPLVFFLGFQIAQYRVSEEAEHRLEQLRLRGIVAVHEARYPFSEHLLENDIHRLPAKFKGLESDLTANDSPRDDLEEHRERVLGYCNQLLMPEQVSEMTECLVSWLDVVRFPTDAEVATRSLTMLTCLTRQAPTGASLAFAFRIFTKTLLLSQSAGIVSVHLASLIFYHCTKLNFPLELTDSVDRRSDVDMWVLFMSMRLGVEVKRFFGLRDAARVETFNAAKRLHKQALNSIASFWGKLISGAGDLVGIIHVTNALTAQRIGAYDTYQRALQSYGTDRQLLLLYSAFLADVMLEPRAAAQVKNFAEELAEEKRSRMLQGKGNNSKVVDAVAMMAGEASTIHSADSSHAAGTDSRTSALRGINKSRFTPTVIIMLGFIVIAVLSGCGIFIAQAVNIQRDRTAINAAEALGMVYKNTAAVDSQLYEMQTFGLNSFDSTVTAPFATGSTAVSAASPGVVVTSNLATISGFEAIFSAYANRFATASYGFSDVVTSALRDLLFSTGLVMLDIGDGQDSWIPSVPTSLFTIVSEFRAAVTTSVNLAAAQSSFAFFGGVVTNNANGALSDGLRLGAQMLLDGISDRGTATTAVAAALLIVGLLALMTTYLAVHVNLENGGNMKATVIQLFTLIPLATQQGLESEAKRRIESFDQWDEEETGDKNKEEDPDKSDSHPEPPGRDGRETSLSGIRPASTGRGGSIDEDFRRGSTMLGRKRQQGSDRLKPILKHVSGYTATGPRRDMIQKKRRVAFDIPESQRKPETGPAKKIAEPKVVLQVSDSVDHQLQAAASAKRGKARAANASKREAIASSNVQFWQSTFVSLVAFGLCVAVIALGAQAVGQSQNEVDKRSDATELVTWAAQVGTSFSNLQDNSKRFIAFGIQQHYNDFMTAIGSSGLSAMYSIPNDITIADSNVREKAAAIRPALQAYVARLQIAITVAAISYAREGPSAPDAALMQWTAETMNAAELSAYANVTNPLSPDYPSSDYVRSLYANASTTNLATLRNLSMSIASSERAEVDRRAAAVAIAEMHAAVIRRLQDMQDDHESTRKATLGGAIGACAGLFVVYCVTLLALVQATLTSMRLSHTTTVTKRIFSVLRSRPRDVALTVTGIIGSFVALWLFVGAAATSVDTSALNHYSDVLQNWRRLADSDAASVDFALGHTSTQAITFFQSQYQASAASNYLFELNSLSPGTDWTSLTSAIANHRLFANISFTLAMWSTGLQNRPSAVLYLPLTSNYDVTREASYTTDVVKYAFDNPSLHYTNFANDILTRNVSVLLETARHAILGERAFDQRKIVYGGISTATTAIANADSFSSNVRFNTRLTIAGMALVSVVFLATFWISVANGIAQLHTTTGVSGAEELLSMLFAATIRYSAAAIALLGLVIVVQFVIVASYQNVGHDMASVVWQAHRRQAHVAETLRLVNEMNAISTSSLNSITFFPLATPYGSFTRMSQVQAKLCTAISDLGQARDSATSSSIGKTSAQVQATYSGTSALSDQLISWVDDTTTLCQLPLTVESAGSVFSNVTKSYIPRYNFDANSRATISTTAASLRGRVVKLWAALEASTTVYKSDADSQALAPMTPGAILIALLVLIAFLEDRLIFDPAGDKIALEEHGAKLLLNMIPVAVRQVVPKIRLYLETGVIVVPEAEANAHLLTDNVITDFINAWQGGVNDEEALPILDQTNYLTCMIDAAGLIVHANTRFMDVLEYEKGDLIGENVKLLCEEPIRSLHDGFLRRYAAGGQSRLVGLKPRDVFALTKSGSRRHIMVRIIELGRPNGSVNFLAIAQPYDIAAVSEDAAVSAALAAIERE